MKAHARVARFFFRLLSRNRMVYQGNPSPGECHNPTP